MDYQRTNIQINWLLNVLHLAIFFLLFLASITINVTESVPAKLFLSFLIVLYTINVLIRPELFENLFKITLTTAEWNHQKKLKWDIDEKDDNEVNTKKPKKHKKKKKTFVSKPTGKNDGISQKQKAQSLSPLDLKNISTKIANYVNNQENRIYADQHNQGAVNTLTKTLARLALTPSEKIDFSDFIDTDIKGSKFSEQNQQNQGKLILGNRMNYFNEWKQKFLENANKKFEKVLKTTLKMQKNQIIKKYFPLRQVIQNRVNKVQRDHKELKLKLIQIAESYFDIKIIESQKSVSQQLDIVIFKSKQPRRCSFEVFLYKILLLFCKKIDFSELGFTLKLGIKKETVELKLNEPILNIFVMINELGLNTQFLALRTDENTQIFVENYTTCIKMVQLYSQQFSSSKWQKQSKGITYLSELAKSRVYALYLIVKQINDNLNSPIIRFNNCLFLDSRQEGNIQFQINKLAKTEGPYLHYDLSILQSGNLKMEYCCQPGDTNYLSVLYLLLFQLKKRESLYIRNNFLRNLVVCYV